MEKVKIHPWRSHLRLRMRWAWMCGIYFTMIGRREITNENLEINTTMKNQNREIETHKEQIIEEVRGIHNIWILNQIWMMIQNIQR